MLSALKKLGIVCALTLSFLVASTTLILTPIARADVACPAGYGNPTLPSVAPYTYQTCTATDGSGNTVRVYIQDDGTHHVGDVATNASTGGTTFKPPPRAAECQEVKGEGYMYGAFRCALAEFFISLMAAIISLLVTLLQWADAALNFAIQNTVVDFQTWFTKLQDPIVKAWTVFRDLSNILIIGLFVFIAISIILGLQEYGQKKLIARVIIVATLINFSFLFTIMVINTSNMLATTIVNTMPQNSTSAPDTVKGIGDQFVKYMGVTSAFDTRNMLFTVYNNPQSSLMGVIAYSFFAGIFVAIATAVFLYGALLLFSRFVILAVILLPLSALAFGLAIVPSLQEGAWGRWWQSLLRNSFLAPIMMLFMLIALNLAIATNGATVAARGVSFADFINNPAKSSLWEFFFGYIIIIGALFGGMYIASKLASGAAGRLASVTGGSLVGAGAGLGAFTGRNTFGRYFAKRGHDKINEAKELNKEIESRRLRGENVTGLEAKYARLLRQGAFANSQAKRTFDLRNTLAGSALQKTGAAKSLTEGTKKNYADVAHKAAEDAAKEASKTALGKSDIEKIAKERAKETYGDAETKHTQAEQEVRDAHQAMRNAREESSNARRAAEQHDQAARAGEEEKRRLEAEHSASSDDADKARLQTQINTVGERIRAARDSAASARTRAGHVEERANLRVRNASQSLKEAREVLSDFNATAKEHGTKISAGNLEHVGKTARENVGNAFQRALYRSTGIGDTFIRHEAEVAATSRAKVKDKAEARAAIDKYNKANDHAPATPKAESGGGDHH